MEISTIIFDLGGVMVRTEWERATKPLGELCGLTPDQVMQELVEGDAYHPFMLGEIDNDEFYRRMTRSFTIEIDRDGLFDIWKSIIVPNTDIAPIVERLRGRYRLVCGSNTDPLHFQAGLDVQPSLEHIEEGILSFKVGHLKPSVEFFKTGLDNLRLAPKESVFIDDRPENAEAARSIGITAFQFTSVPQLEADLKNLGLL